MFALGSSAYPNFCNFGKYVDKLLGDLGGERIHDLATGDEMCGQDQAFRKWASGVFNVSAFKIVIRIYSTGAYSRILKLITGLKIYTCLDVCLE